ncbi:hypothetical protein HPP92_026085 [Vanilla planifolia]|uniref:AB hydrolase-1 domain-containing protein n=1 Tax=Vanilla planifolia TaxID=51239 RepID=A0A835PGH6_VANPL|nr:hypothetical protein HPP92_026085 [Vanilla planifolia]
METIASRMHFHHVLRHLLRRLASLLVLLLPPRLSPVALKDFLLSLLLLLCGLSPRTLSVGGGATSLHVWAPRRRRLDRPSLVLLHGFGGFSKWQFERQLAPLSRSFDLYIPDLVFFGRSQSGDRRRSVKFQARSVAEAMRQMGVGRYAVAGVSYGGFVAFRMAADAAAAEVESVVIMTSGISSTAEERREMAQREKRDVAELLLPQRVEDLRNLFQRCMHRPPWMPSFYPT